MHNRRNQQSTLLPALAAGLLTLCTLPQVWASPAPKSTRAPARVVKGKKATTGSASAVRYERSRTRVRVRGDQLDGRVKQARQAEARRAKGDTPTAAPPVPRSEQRVKTQILDKQIAMLKRLIRTTTPDDPEYADLVFRLASLHLEKKARYEHKAGELYEAIFQAEQAESKPPAKPRVKRSPQSGRM